MKKLTTAINYLLVQPDELPPAEQALVQKAIDATNNSYARYSNFHVGAACLLENGNIVYRLRLPIMIFGIFFTLFLLWIKNKNVNKVFPQMYGMFLITFAVANFGYSDMIFYGRVLKMATLVGYAYLFMVISQKENVNTIKSLFVKSIMGGIVLFGLATALVEERMFLLNIPLWFGNFFTEIPLIEYDD